MFKFCLSLIVASVALADASGPTVLVTGATGRTGSIVYDLLKKAGADVRAFVRDAEKAKKLLNCTKCDESEGIFVGDLLKPDTLAPAMAGANSLVITTSAVPNCDDLPFEPCGYHNGSYPVDIDFHGGLAQIDAFGEASKGLGNVVMISSMGTTDPNNPVDKIGDGHIGFYKLNEESHLMGSGMPWAIVKPCGLGDEDPMVKELVVSHDDVLAPSTVPRADVARVIVEAVLKPKVSRGTRFDLCSKEGTPTTDLEKLFASARPPWQHAGKMPIMV